MGKNDYLFFYGTLRRGSKDSMYHLLARYADFVDDVTFQGNLYKIEDYPGAVHSDNSQDIVYGEVYLLREGNHVLSKLDNYEECGCHSLQPTLFKREKTNVQLGNGRQISAWVYIYNHPTENLQWIPSGDYLQFND